jgi:hypothetical protein
VPADEDERIVDAHAATAQRLKSMPRFIDSTRPHRHQLAPLWFRAAHATPRADGEKGAPSATVYERYAVRGLFLS